MSPLILLLGDLGPVPCALIQLATIVFQTKWWRLHGRNLVFLCPFPDDVAAV